MDAEMEKEFLEKLNLLKKGADTLKSLGQFFAADVLVFSISALMQTVDEIKAKEKKDVVS
jgi:hypothetical protein